MMKNKILFSIGMLLLNPVFAQNIASSTWLCKTDVEDNQDIKITALDVIDFSANQFQAARAYNAYLKKPNFYSTAAETFQGKWHLDKNKITLSFSHYHVDFFARQEHCCDQFEDQSSSFENLLRTQRGQQNKPVITEYSITEKNAKKLKYSWEFDIFENNKKKVYATCKILPKDFKQNLPKANYEAYERYYNQL